MAMAVSASAAGLDGSGDQSHLQRGQSPSQLPTARELVGSLVAEVFSLLFLCEFSCCLDICDMPEEDGEALTPEDILPICTATLDHLIALDEEDVFNSDSLLGHHCREYIHSLVNARGDNLLLAAVRTGDTGLIELLVQQMDFPCDYVNPNTGESALHLCCAKCADSACVDLVLQQLTRVALARRQKARQQRSRKRLGQKGAQSGETGNEGSEGARQISAYVVNQSSLGLHMHSVGDSDSGENTASLLKRKRQQQDDVVFVPQRPVPQHVLALQTLARTIVVADHPNPNILGTSGEKEVEQLWINACTWSGCTPLHVAAAFGRVKTVEYLLAAGADPYVIDAMGRTALHAVVRSGSMGTCLAAPFLPRNPAVFATPRTHTGTHSTEEETGERIEKKKITDWRSVGVSASVSTKSAIAVLCEWGPQLIDFPDLHGNVPLHFAVWNGYKDVVVDLLQTACEPNIANHQGQTPLAIALTSTSNGNGNGDVGDVRSNESLEQQAGELQVSPNQMNIIAVLKEYGGSKSTEVAPTAPAAAAYEYEYGEGADPSNLSQSSTKQHSAYPSMWDEYEDEYGNPYYYNRGTGETQWATDAAAESQTHYDETANYDGIHQQQQQQQQQQEQHHYEEHYDNQSQEKRGDRRGSFASPLNIPLAIAEAEANGTATHLRAFAARGMSQSHTQPGSHSPHSHGSTGKGYAKSSPSPPHQQGWRQLVRNRGHGQGQGHGGSPYSHSNSNPISPSNMHTHHWMGSPSQHSQMGSPAHSQHSHHSHSPHSPHSSTSPSHHMSTKMSNMSMTNVGSPPSRTYLNKPHNQGGMMSPAITPSRQPYAHATPTRQRGTAVQSLQLKFRKLATPISPMNADFPEKNEQVQ